MQEELEVLKGYIESLKLHERAANGRIARKDMDELIDSLREADEIALADFISNFHYEAALENFISSLYG